LFKVQRAVADGGQRGGGGAGEEEPPAATDGGLGAEHAEQSLLLSFWFLSFWF